MSEKITLKINDVDVEYVRADSIAKKPALGPEVIIRTRSAGVHIGSIGRRDEDVVLLHNARRLWQWKGAFTLNAVAAKGIDRKGSRISCAVEQITLLGVLEIIPICEGVDLTSTEK